MLVFYPFMLLLAQSLINTIFMGVCQLIGITKNNCTGYIEIVQIATQSLFNSWLDKDFRCWLYDLCPADQFRWLNDEDAIKDIISDKPPVNRPLVNQSGQKIKILQITDIHVDPRYKAGSPAECQELLCCRQSTQSSQLKGDAIAGQYGYPGKCDLPYSTVLSFFDETLLNENPPDILLWTGDNPAHNIWQLNRDNINQNVLNITSLIKDHYKYKGQVIPVWGNHGELPNDQFDYRSDRDSGILSELAAAWKQFIGEKAFKQFNQTGYYSVDVPATNAKAIVLNSMLHDTYNFFNFQDQTDPLKQVIKSSTYRLNTCNVV